MAKIINLQLIKFFLIKMIFFFCHKIDWFSLVLLYMWVTYKLILTSFSVQIENFRFLEILAITNPIVN